MDAGACSCAHAVDKSVDKATEIARYLMPHNAAVERPRDEPSSAARVHNEMTHMRRARDAESRPAASAC